MSGWATGLGAMGVGTKRMSGRGGSGHEATGSGNKDKSGVGGETEFGECGWMLGVVGDSKTRMGVEGLEGTGLKSIGWEDGTEER